MLVVKLHTLTNVGVLGVAIGAFVVACSGHRPGILRTEVGRGTVGDSYTVEGHKGSDVVVQAVTIQPGAASGWHTHPGPEVAIIKSGTLTFFNGDDPKCEAKAYTAGQVVTGLGHVHQGSNLSTEPVEIVVTYFDVPPGGPATVPAERPTQCPE
jgi:quercetin dioxygenase-like cupin family protein